VKIVLNWPRNWGLGFSQFLILCLDNLSLNPYAIDRTGKQKARRKKMEDRLTSEQKWEIYNIFMESLDQSNIPREERICMQEQAEIVLWGEELSKEGPSEDDLDEIREREMAEYWEDIRGEERYEARQERYREEGF
jgi:hypothetical protein